MSRENQTSPVVHSDLVERLRAREQLHRIDGELIAGGCIADIEAVDEAANLIAALSTLPVIERETVSGDVRRRRFKEPIHQQAYDQLRAKRPDVEDYRGFGGGGNAYAVGYTMPDTPNRAFPKGSKAYAHWAAGVDNARVDALATLTPPRTAGWDHRYRRLEAGETILPTDEVQNDDGSWKANICAGQQAPDPLYTSHRTYRRLVGTAGEADVLADELERLIAAAHKEADDIRFYSGGSKRNHSMELLAEMVCRKESLVLAALRNIPLTKGTGQ